MQTKYRVIERKTGPYPFMVQRRAWTLFGLLPGTWVDINDYRTVEQAVLVMHDLAGSPTVIAEA